MGHILSLFTYLLTTSVSGRVPGYPSYYPTGTRVINYPDMAAVVFRPPQSLIDGFLSHEMITHQRQNFCLSNVDGSREPVRQELYWARQDWKVYDDYSYGWNAEFNARHNLPGDGSLLRRSSQPITWLILTNKTHKLNTAQIRKQRRIQQHKTSLVQSPFTTIVQETRWAYSRKLPISHGVSVLITPLPLLLPQAVLLSSCLGLGIEAPRGQRSSLGLGTWGLNLEPPVRSLGLEPPGSWTLWSWSWNLRS